MLNEFCRFIVIIEMLLAYLLEYVIDASERLIMTFDKSIINIGNKH